MSPNPTRLYMLAAVLGATGVSLMVLPQGSSGAPLASRTGSPPAVSPQPPTTTTTGAATPGPPPSTTVPAAPATAPPVAATAPPPPPAPPPQTATPRPPASSRAKPVPSPGGRTAAAAGGSQLDQVERIADGSGWDWRKAHVHFQVAFNPADCCHWGSYDHQDHKTIWIGPSAFDNAARLRYVVLHELGHAWQWHSHRLKKLQADMAPWGYQDVAALEAGADCIAALWGADLAGSPYWTCPAPAREVTSRRLAGQWK